MPFLLQIKKRISKFCSQRRKIRILMNYCLDCRNRYDTHQVYSIFRTSGNRGFCFCFHIPFWAMTILKCRGVKSSGWGTFAGLIHIFRTLLSLLMSDFVCLIHKHGDIDATVGGRKTTLKCLQNKEIRLQEKNVVFF